MPISYRTLYICMWYCSPNEKQKIVKLKNCNERGCGSHNVCSILRSDEKSEFIRQPSLMSMLFSLWGHLLEGDGVFVKHFLYLAIFVSQLKQDRGAPGC